MSHRVVCVADFGASNTSLTVHGKLFNGLGVLTTTVTTGVVGLVGGVYLYILDTPDGHEGAFIMYDSANPALRRSIVIAPRETENNDVKTSSIAVNANNIADAVLTRSASNVEDTAGLHTLAGLILAQFEGSAPGETWTIYKTDGVTIFATRTLTEDPAAKPVTGVSA